MAADPLSFEVYLPLPTNAADSQPVPLDPNDRLSTCRGVAPGLPPPPCLRRQDRASWRVRYAGARGGPNGRRLSGVFNASPSGSIAGDSVALEDEEAFYEREAFAGSPALRRLATRYGTASGLDSGVGPREASASSARPATDENALDRGAARPNMDGRGRTRGLESCDGAEGSVNEGSEGHADCDADAPAVGTRDEGIIVYFKCTLPYFALFDTRPCTTTTGESGVCSWAADCVRLFLHRCASEGRVQQRLCDTGAEAVAEDLSCWRGDGDATLAAVPPHTRDGVDRSGGCGRGPAPVDCVVLPAFVFTGWRLRPGPYHSTEVPCPEPTGRYTIPSLDMPLCELLQEFRDPCRLVVLEVPAHRLGALVEWFLNHPEPDMFPHMAGARVAYTHPPPTPAPHATLSDRDAECSPRLYPRSPLSSLSSPLTPLSRPRSPFAAYGDDGCGEGACPLRRRRRRRHRAPVQLSMLLVDGGGGAYLPPAPGGVYRVAVPQTVSCGLRGAITSFVSGHSANPPAVGELAACLRSAVPSNPPHTVDGTGLPDGHDGAIPLFTDGRLRCDVCEASVGCVHFAT